ncbi:hypothetical protein J2S05_002391 [Alkalicoccobacillus murimartini]|uniref:Holin-like toxin n=1 Tax=Alkalicoccobacillus murimartini TaxID=171685 RepID=A0ABT9YIA6_9BACI|nr:hypothetical protein [Alkalicoccobacillus murimartini]
MEYMNIMILLGSGLAILALVSAIIGFVLFKNK